MRMLECPSWAETYFRDSPLFRSRLASLFHGCAYLPSAVPSDIQQGYRVFYRETHTLINDIADAALDGTRKEHMELLSTVPLLIIDDLGMRKLPPTAAEDLSRSLCGATNVSAHC
jgi:hypothetical protein